MSFYCATILEIIKNTPFVVCFFIFFILRVKILLYYAFLIENTKLTLRRS
jgi:hypothetical protein